VIILTATLVLLSPLMVGISVLVENMDNRLDKVGGPVNQDVSLRFTGSHGDH
jgi:hypothetical protein